MKSFLAPIALLAVVTSAACSAPPVEVPLPPRDYTPLVTRSLWLWDRAIGFRNQNITIVVRDRPIWLENTAIIGMCMNEGKHTEIYPKAFKGNRFYFEEKFESVVLHELVHAHMSCSNKDHSDDPRDLMYPELTILNIGAMPSIDDLEHIAATWADKKGAATK